MRKKYVQRITQSEILNGIIIEQNKYISETLVTHKDSGFVKIVKNIKSLNE